MILITHAEFLTCPPVALGVAGCRELTIAKIFPCSPDFHKISAKLIAFVHRFQICILKPVAVTFPVIYKSQNKMSAGIIDYLANYEIIFLHIWLYNYYHLIVVFTYVAIYNQVDKVQKVLDCTRDD